MDGALARRRRAGHDVDHVPVEPGTSFPTEVATTFELARRLSTRVREAVAAGRRPPVLSGGCCSAAGRGVEAALRVAEARADAG